MDIRCADCGGNVWRSVTMHRPGHEGRMVTTHTFTCDTCGEKRECEPQQDYPDYLTRVCLQTRLDKMKDELEAERADHEATKKWLRRAHNLLGGIAK